MKHISICITAIILIASSLQLSSPVYSQTTTQSIGVFFENTQVTAASDGTIEVDIIFSSDSTVKVSAAKLSLTYPSALLEYLAAPDTSTISPTCNNLRLPALTQEMRDISTGLVNISRVNSGTEQDLPSGIFCFSAVTFKPKIGIPLPSVAYISLDTTLSNWQVVGPQGELTPQFESFSSTVTVNIVPDTTPPSVSWISPVTAEGQVYSIAGGTVPIEVSATDGSGVAQVHFIRWDAVNLRVVDIGTVLFAPYRVSVDVSTLNLQWNEIHADVYDYAGNVTGTYFWIYRTPNLLANGSFEDDSSPADGKPDVWSTNKKFTRSSETTPVDGTYVGKFRATDNSGATIKQTVNNLTAGVTYSFSCWTQIPLTSDSFKFQYQMQWKNASNSTIKTETVKTYADDTNGVWNQAAKSLVAPAGTVKAIVMMKASSLNGTIYVDQCVLQ